MSFTTAPNITYIATDETFYCGPIFSSIYLRQSLVALSLSEEAPS